MEKYYLHLTNEQKGPFTIGQLQARWRAGEINLNTQFWTKVGGKWETMEAILDLLEPPRPVPASVPLSPAVPLASAFSKLSAKYVNPPAAPTNPPKPVRPSEVKQGASIGGWLCFGLGVLFMYFSLWSFILYLPLFLVAFILAIMALAQKRIGSGISLLLSCLVVPAVLWIYLGATRTAKTIESAARAMEQEGESMKTQAPQPPAPPKPAPPPVLALTIPSGLAASKLPDPASEKPAISDVPKEVDADTSKLQSQQSEIAAVPGKATPFQGRSSGGMDGERYPRTRMFFLSAEEVEGLNADQLRYAINEMYARHGAEFKNPELKGQFEKLPWYQPVKKRSYDDAELLFSAIETQNIKILGLRRDELKGKPGIVPGAYKESAWQRPGTKEKTAVDRANAELDHLYNQLMSSLGAQQQKTLREEKLVWIKWRDQEITRLLGEPRGGSGYRMDYWETMLALVQKRTAELKSARRR